METKKLNLNELKVDSFITSLESQGAQTVKGGTVHTYAVYNAIVYAVAYAYVKTTQAVDAVVNGEKEETEEGTNTEKK